MIKAAFAMVLMSFRQPSAQQDNMTKPGMNGSSDSSMKKGSRNNGATGMSDGMKADDMASGGMKKDMSKDGSPSADTMRKDGKSN
jgi:hypothetical protein